MPEEPAQPQRRQLNLNLNQDAVMAPALNALRLAGGTIVIALKAIDEADLAGPVSIQGPNLAFQFDDGAADADARRAMYKSWLLAKGFQDLVRGLRETLEAAFVWIELLKLNGQPLPQGGLAAHIEGLRASANKKNFPDLMAAVNAGLAAALNWEAAFMSLQKVRNCLEHRGGVVSQDKDAGAGNANLTLTFPRMQIVIRQGEQEVELVPPMHLAEGGDVLMRPALREHAYPVGTTITFDTESFGEIAFASWMMAADLVGKLPKPPAPPPVAAGA